MFNTPVLFLVFNRPDTTAQVFEQIRAVQPKYLFVAADGPRAHKEGEAQLCQQVRAIATAIDWDCEVKTLFREQNLGCGKAVSEAITWFFEQVEEGVILEDDCLPDISFFTFSAAMLKRYRTNERVMHIAGANFQNGIKRGDGDYYYSKYPHIWGWATWRRAWNEYDYTVKKVKKFRRKLFTSDIFLSKMEKRFWIKTWECVYLGKIDTWDYQWAFSVITNKGLCIMPNKNLVSNLGFGPNATHTQGESRFSKMEIDQLWSFSPPSKLEIDREADKLTCTEFNYLYSEKKKTILNIIKTLIKK